MVRYSYRHRFALSYVVQNYDLNDNTHNHLEAVFEESLFHTLFHVLSFRLLLLTLQIQNKV